MIELFKNLNNSNSKKVKKKSGFPEISFGDFSDLLEILGFYSDFLFLFFGDFFFRSNFFSFL